MLRVVNIVGTRPNLVKMAVVLAAQRARPDVFEPLLVHTQQHHDPAMSEQLFAELELPPPDVMLAGASGGQAAQIGRMLVDLERVLARIRPDLVVVVGDVNSSAAGALAAATLGIPVAHVEAGLRSFDRTMPEEVNRVVIDAVSEFLFASEASAVANLAREGLPAAAVHHVGNVMIDALVRFRPRAAGRAPTAALGIVEPYGVLTLHRPSNVDRASTLEPLLRAVGKAAHRLPIVFPVHPRTRDRLDASGLGAALAGLSGLRITPPLGYLDMMALLEHAQLVLTDSGGVQEETTYLGVPCLTLRDTTERPATVTDGTNRVVGTRPERALAEIGRVLDGDRPPPRRPPLWDGRAAERIADVLATIGGSTGRRGGRRPRPRVGTAFSFRGPIGRRLAGRLADTRAQSGAQTAGATDFLDRVAPTARESPARSARDVIETPHAEAHQTGTMAHRDLTAGTREANARKRIRGSSR